MVTGELHVTNNSYQTSCTLICTVTDRVLLFIPFADVGKNCWLLGCYTLVILIISSILYLH